MVLVLPGKHKLTIIIEQDVGTRALTLLGGREAATGGADSSSGSFTFRFGILYRSAFLKRKQMNKL